MKKTIKLIGNIGILLFTILLCLLVGELIIRLFIGTKNIVILATPPIIKDKELVYRNAPNWKGKLWYSSLQGFYEVRVNSMGLNEREVNFKKEKNKPRILFLGDSITFGIGVDVDKTFVRIVENLLNFQLSYNPTLSGIRRVETLNGGVPAYHSWQEIAFLRKIGLKYQPDIVVLDFYLNDVEPYKSAREIKQFREDKFASLKYRYNVPLPFKDFLREKSRLYWVGRRVCNLMIAKLFSTTQTPRNKKTQDAPPLPFDKWKTDRSEFLNLTYVNRFDWGAPWNSDACYDNFRKYIRELKDLAQKNNFKLVIVFFPVEYQLETTFLEDNPQGKFTKIAGEEDVLFLDLLPLMRDCNIRPDSLYFDWCHLTLKGHQFTAEKISQFLREHDI
ncbi:MAG: SGNH/GDSL hydrolase family protein [bacterium]